MIHQCPFFFAVRRMLLTLSLVVALLLLAGCGTGAVLGEVSLSAASFAPTETSAPLTISYAIGRQAQVDIYLLAADGTRYDLRRDEVRPAHREAYVLRFDGTVPTNDPMILRRMLPPGDYQVVVAATAADDQQAERRLPLTIAGSEIPLPAIENLLVAPEVISPNADAIDDVAEFTYRLPITATVDIAITTPTGEVVPVVTREQEGPFEQHHVWNGKRPNGSLLPAGVYTYTVRAEDLYGNVVQRQGNIGLEDVGHPEARIVSARIAPQRVMLGSVITVTVRVRNTGEVPIRTYGPASGYEFSTNEVFSSVEDGRFAAQAGGFWRVGVDWDANSGGGALRYPFRWALSERPPEDWTVPGVEDFLMPGEEVEIVGRVQILRRETRMGFYVGLIQDGVGFFQDRTARTIIEVGF
ncbi:hypothetical protein [Candidatus Viridilinea mediisalina]|uniref:FlgD Ig-like domain-containing protein n=1 Tax=Candidatus Viridilinea mediisalina TaxID=2024553 RepID=A0A2A6REC6_9CHLR|nr:hypothetical protein [Candidatus Viridilinea mediisalina]PDW00799.1 hypothetical protein CJ255_20245 [Candidatus Viridilinea mediisalina]